MANLAVGAASLGYAVIVPALVVRRFGADVYGTWYLAFQVAAYVVLLDLGSQYVVTNEAAAAPSDPRSARLASAAMLGQIALAFAVVAVAATWAALTGEPMLARLFVILGVAALVSLLASTVRAWFVGLERADIPAAWLVAARAGAVAGLCVAVAAHAGLIMLTAAVAVPQLAIHAGFLTRARRPPSPWAQPDTAAFGQLLRDTLPLALWTVCGILIGGIDIFVVRAVDPRAVGQYAIALPLLAIPVGVVTAAITAWMPRIARLQVRDPEAARDATLTATTVITAGLCIGAIAFIGYGDRIVRVLAGGGHWDSAATYLRLLYLASALRFVFLPWSILVVARREQARITMAPLTEASVNVVASVLLGLWLGAVGVALGTLVGVFAATALYMTWAVPRTARSGVTSRGLARAAVEAWPPFVAAAALGLVALAGGSSPWRGVAAVAGTGVDVWWLLNLRARRRFLLWQLQS